MPNLSCYRLLDTFSDIEAPDFDDFIVSDKMVSGFGPEQFGTFDAKLYVSASPSHPPAWSPLLTQGFPDSDWPSFGSVGAVLIVALRDGGGMSTRWFAFTFGPGGRFLLRTDSYRRGFGLRAALNVLAEPVRIVRRASVRLIRDVGVQRSDGPRVQTSAGVPISTFGVDQLRDLVTRADGVPADEDTWGSRISGGDSVHVQQALDFEELGGSV